MTVNNSPTRSFRMVRRIGWVLLIGALLLVLVPGARVGIAAFQVATDRQPVPQLADIGSTRSLVVLPIFEKAADKGLASGHGVSYLLQTDTTAVLMDMGFNPDAQDPSPLEQNMAALGLGIDDFDAVVISHHHPDHVGSVDWWLNNTFSLGVHQDDLGSKEIYTPIAMHYPGAGPIVSATPRILAPGVATLGNLSFVNVFPLSLLEPLMQEQVLAVNVESVGIVLITGCGHPGVERIITHAEQVLNRPIAGIIGGLHLGDAAESELQDEIATVRKLEPAIVALSPHDSSEGVIAVWRTAFPAAYRDLKVGAGLQLP
ncbi:MAG: MBL fold metallo-hydrolase [Anaerolineales bacterium]|nr:MBL fold metallo-hydrolase [Anaerolineales bacterium]